LTDNKDEPIAYSKQITAIPSTCLRTAIHNDLERFTIFAYNHLWFIAADIANDTDPSLQYIWVIWG